MHNLTRVVRGFIAFLVLGLNTVLAAFPIFFISLLKFLVPVRSWRRTCTGLLNRIAEFWINCNEIWLPKPEKIVWKNLDPEDLRADESYLIISNHQSWADIFLVQHLLNQRIPQIKFFLKQELIWVPVIGLCWWALDFPFMKRYSKSYLKKYPDRKGADQATTIRACEKFRDQPVAIYNFMEGTRFTREKHERQQPRFRHLLKPRAGGTGLVLSALGDRFRFLINITICYQNTPPPGFWGILAGDNGEATIVIEKTTIPPDLLNRNYSEDAAFRAELLHWVNNLWEEKDRLLDELQKTGNQEPAETQEGAEEEVRREDTGRVETKAEDN